MKEIKRIIEKQASKYIIKLDRATQRRIIDGIDGLPDNGDIKKLKGHKEKLYRLRIGGYRIIFKNEKAKNENNEDMLLIKITTVDTRGDVY